MSHFAEIDNNNIVTRVVAFDDNDMSEEDAKQFLEERLGGRWIQTSYNTYANTHLLGGTPFRKNYAGVGMTYDENLDGFIYEKPEDFPSFILDEETGHWVAPVPFPGKKPQDPREFSLEYIWDEENVQWIPNPDWIAPE